MTAPNQFNRDEDLIDWIHLNVFEKKIFNDIRGWVTTTISNSIRNRPDEDPSVAYLLEEVTIWDRDNKQHNAYRFEVSIYYSQDDFEKYEAFFRLNRGNVIDKFMEKDAITLWQAKE